MSSLTAQAKVEAKVVHQVACRDGSVHTFTFYSSPNRFKQAAWNCTRGLVTNIRIKRFARRQARLGSE